jgi:hypothetical protein
LRSNAAVLAIKFTANVATAIFYPDIDLNIIFISSFVCCFGGSKFNMKSLIWYAGLPLPRPPAALAIVQANIAARRSARLSPNGSIE